MSLDKFHSLVSDMEPPLRNLSAIAKLLGEMVDLCGPGESKALIYDHLERSISLEAGELHRLWDELNNLPSQGGDKPPLKSVKE